MDRAIISSFRMLGSTLGALLMRRTAADTYHGFGLSYVNA
jgi:hypothetical protein